MNFIFISLILFALFVITCADLERSSSSPLSKSDETEERGRSLPLAKEKKENEKSDDHAGDHDQDDKSASSGSSVKARKGVFFNETHESNVKSTDVHISNDRASTTITKTSESVPNSTVEVSSPVKSKVKTDSERTSSSGSYKYSPYDSKSTKTDTSSSTNVKENDSTSSNYSKSSATISSSNESTSYSKSSSKYSSKSSSNKKPLITYSVEDDPTLLNIPITRQIISPLTPTDAKLDADDQAYLPPSSDFVLDRMQSKREMYIFPLVVLIFLVPMVLGVGIIILRRVRDYWSTRHYRRMDFLVDGMYNT